MTSMKDEAVEVSSVAEVRHCILRRLHGMVPGSRSLRSLGRDDTEDVGRTHPLVFAIPRDPNFGSGAAL